MNNEEYEEGYELLKSIKEPITADEMFKRLGYKGGQYFGYIKYIKRLKQICCDDVEELQIWFYQFDETFEKKGEAINMKELQAINKKVEELGWNE